MMKKIKWAVYVVLTAALLAGCGKNSTETNKKETIVVEQNGGAAVSGEDNNTTVQENPAEAELVTILNEMEAETDLETSENHAVLAAASLMNWGVGTPLTVEQIRKVTEEWMSEKSQEGQSEFTQKFSYIYDAYQKLLGEEAEELLAAANCNYAAYPWSDSPLETIETIAEVVRQ